MLSLFSNDCAPARAPGQTSSISPTIERILDALRDKLGREMASPDAPHNQIESEPAIEAVQARHVIMTTTETLRGPSSYVC